MVKNKLVFGVGLVDVDYQVHKTEILNGERRIVWTCPYYSRWKEMLRRCFSVNYQKRYPNYKDCSVCQTWLKLSNFKKWVDEQPNKNWESCHLDKDLICYGNKLYSPLTCVFINPSVNIFTINRGAKRGDYMLGVSTVRSCKQSPYLAGCGDPFGTNQQYIGSFNTELEAHKAWQAKKHEYACQLADLQEDPRVADALRQRYAPDKDWTTR